MSKNVFILFFLMQVFVLSTTAQEVEFIINIDRQQAPNIPKNIADELKTAMTTFVNNRRWTNDQYSPQERIKCNINYTLDQSSSVGRYIGIAQIQFIRPIYGTTYESVLLTFIDKNFDFEFAQGQPLDYNENAYLSNVVSLLSFYVNIALALDYDSFSKMGGSQYVEKAFALANVAQSANPPALASNRKNGWETSEFNNRMALMVNLNNQQFIPFREGLYIYHREGLDKFMDNPEESRKKIIEVLKKIKTTRQAVSVSILNGSFFLGKKQELIQIFSKASTEMKTEVLNLLRELDTVNADAYSVIMKN